ncbi:hypothetical protein TGAM01_v200809 [Trichoderma gamsii]|uniref:histone acetyltransferase n=1 Tax=Trichoderma gamsii TaxID=398673 RepID=A0A2P5A1E6_9HYPO|nr:hypothetical protein TGAM01_v200809 [Trichoderma gamsii]PON30369.1 hypothetical protein TGAM01_v200809 [Trichoderma gamsii]
MPQKRKRPDEPAAQPDPDPQSSSTRRATRQTPVHPPPVPASALLPPVPATNKMAAAPLPAVTAVPLPQMLMPDPQKRLARNGAARPAGAKTSAHPATLPSLEATAPNSAAAPNSSTIVPPLPSPNSIRVAAAPVPLKRGAAAADLTSGGSAKERRRPSDLVAPEITYHVPQANQHGRLSSLVRPHGPSAPPPRLDKIATPMVITPVLPPKPPTLPVSDRPPPRTDRNIDKVVLGNLCFRTWYPSYYGKEVLGATSGNAKGGSKDGPAETGGKAPAKKEKDGAPMLERLYVCPCCFKYAKELVAWWGHVKLCQQRAHVPGKKVYVHPKGRRMVYVAQDGSSRAPGQKKRRGEGNIRYVEEIVQDEGEWSLWEVDGEQDVLFCQNLSLFAKLFLDNKSVFFDVTGFNYFLLVYTPPTAAAPSGTAAPPVTPQITGFFSKEKMSWDNNNLACILMFPPWQRKGLGALLMGASYEISRREGIMGGPEKPISDLGKKGYQRFWAGEIARWLLGLEIAPVDSENASETLVDVEDCSQATWISSEDCLSVLRDMGVVEDAGIGPGKPEPVEETHLPLSEEEKKKKQAAGEEEGKQSGKRASAEAEDEKQQPKSVVKQVPRVRLDKEAVRRYVAAHRIILDKTCDPNGFVEGYAMKRADKASSESVESRDEALAK